MEENSPSHNKNSDHFLIMKFNFDKMTKIKSLWIPIEPIIPQASPHACRQLKLAWNHIWKREKKTYFLCWKEKCIKVDKNKKNSSFLIRFCLFNTYFHHKPSNLPDTMIDPGCGATTAALVKAFANVELPRLRPKLLGYLFSHNDMVRMPTISKWFKIPWKEKTK